MVKKPKKDADTAPSTSFNPVIIESKNCSTVVMMLASEEIEILAKACEAIGRFAMKSDDNKLQLHSLNTIDKLIPLISHEDKHVKRYACMAYAVMVKCAEVRIALRKADPNCIISAIQLLNDDDEVVVEFACLFLANVSIDFISKSVIREAGAIDQLISHVNNSSDPDVQKNSLDCLAHLVEDHECRPTVREAGIVSCLMEKISSDYPAIQQVALKTLATLLEDELVRTQFREIEGPEKILPLLTKKYADLHVVSIQVLSNCLIDPDTTDEMRNNGGIDQLMNFVNENYPTVEVKLHAAKAIGRIAKNERNTKILHEQNVEQCLVSLLNNHVDNEDIIIAVCHTIAVLSKSMLARETFGEVDSIPLLVALIPAENPSVGEAACLALANITLENLNNSQDLVKAGGLDYLITAIRSGKDMVAVNAAACVINMSAEITVRQEIIKHGVIEAIGKSLTSTNPIVQSKIAELLAVFVDGSAPREQIIQNNVLEPLVALLHSKNVLVRKNTCLAIIRCASDPQIADVLLRLGALELLFEINCSADKRINSSVMAFEKLIESNLSAKYGVVGKLAARDIIGQQFYDAGKIRRNGKFLPLDVLGKQAIDSNRAVLLINYKPEDDYCDDGNKQWSGETPQCIKSTDRRDSNDGRDSSRDSKDHRPSSKTSGKRKNKKDKEAQLREEQERLQREKEEKERLEQEREAQLLKESIYQPPLDENLLHYSNEVMKTIEPLPSYREQVIALAQFVSSCMGGEIERDRMLEFAWQLHIAELKVQFNSNVIPLGEIKRGTYFHRALLYKVLADRLGVPCTLIRGNYNLAWNEVMISGCEDMGSFPPQKYIVDLMHDPGRLIRDGTPEANIYQTI